MKNYILIILICLTPTLLIAQATPNELAQQFADALMKNDTNTIFSFYPSYQEVLTYAENQGIPLPPEEELPVIEERAAQSFLEFKYQIQEFRLEVEEEGYDWTQIQQDDILVEELVESYSGDEEDAEEQTFTYYAITITFSQGDESFNIFFGAFDVEDIYKIAMEIDSDL